MYVCVCNAIRADELRASALRCAGDAEAVYDALGAVPRCRQCLDHAEEIISAERASAGSPG